MTQFRLTGRRRIVLVAAALVLSACSAVGIEENTFESGPLPAVADDNVPSVLATVDDLVNEANVARDPELLATAATDPLLAVETGRYALDATADPDNADPLPPVSHVDPTAFVPQLVGYPQWFVTVSTVVPDLPMRIEVLERPSSAAAWTMPMSTDLQPGVEFPTLALDDAGYVVPVTGRELAELPLDVEELAAAHVEALSGAEVSGAGAGLADDPWTVQRRDADAARATTVGDAATVASMYAVTAALTQALRTEDGGALVFYALSERTVYTVQPNFFLQLDPATATLVGTAEITASLTEDWAALVAAYLPPDETTPPRVIGARFDRVGIAGS